MLVLVDDGVNFYLIVSVVMAGCDTSLILDGGRVCHESISHLCESQQCPFAMF